MDEFNYYNFRTNWLFSEMKCHCGCGFVVQNRKFIIILSYARALAGFSWPINSWCRCKKHNFKVGGSTNSSHLKGFAVDISFRDSLLKYKIIQALSAVGFKRIGVGLDFIHVDMDHTRAYQGMWLYKHKGGMIKWTKKTELGQLIDKSNASQRLSGGSKTSSLTKRLRQSATNR